jgi:hypothetical protein
MMTDDERREMQALKDENVQLRACIQSMRHAEASALLSIRAAQAIVSDAMHRRGHADRTWHE